VIADFEELEAPALRRELNKPGPGHSLTERLMALRLLQGAIDECRHRSIRVPREIHRLRADISRQIYTLTSARTPASNEQKKHGIEYNVALIGASPALMLLGGGRPSVDEAFQR
jgi:hypothetical protein